MADELRFEKAKMSCTSMSKTDICVPNMHISPTQSIEAWEIWNF
ncbi:uncharacterized protein RSE6_00205 [Rhynchosporium secalis]|uniref:Uncharacterized protein n=1 Tax=Rhynchosporium secalis TaxID=38038 RepID=A0A1E1LWD4_RHYSE|nr:uncharacterized protein RSE6_00205 [Rhynchosporium secalis]